MQKKNNNLQLLVLNKQCNIHKLCVVNLYFVIYKHFTNHLIRIDYSLSPT